MRIKKIGTKLMLITIISIVIMTVTVSVVMFVGYNGIIDEITAGETQTSMNYILSTVEEMKTKSTYLTEQASTDPDVVAALESGDKESVKNAVKHVLMLLGADTDFGTVCDVNGNVVARIHSDKSGDSLMNQLNIQEALKGNTGAYIEPGTEVKLSVRSSSPIKNEDGQIIGLFSTGYLLDSPKFVDKIKYITGAEATVFLYDERINTTIEKDGVRQTGTKLDESMAEIVLNQKNVYSNEIKLFDKPYSTIYYPIINHEDKAIGIFFVGVPLEDIESSKSLVTILTGTFIAVLTILVSVLLALYVKKAISNPITKLKTALNEVADGNLDVNTSSNSQDEIGELTRTTGTLVDTITSLIKGLDKMSAEFNKGDIDARIDSTQYRGAYKTVVEDVNLMVGDIMEAVSTFLSCIKDIGSGNFNADIPMQPGKKAMMNQTVQVMRENLKSVSEEINKILREASKGKLSYRSNTDGYKGDWYDIMHGLNLLMDAIAEPIREAEHVLEAVAKGDFSNQVKGDYQGDFLIIKRCINKTVINIESYITEISDVLEAIAKDNLTRDISGEYVGEFTDIKDSINMIVTRLNNVISEIYSAAEQVTAGAENISESSMSLAQGTTEQASSVEELNASINIINEKTSNTAMRAREGDELSNKSMESAGTGSKNMKDMLLSMDGIKESSNKISNIIKVIEDIAFQTNLLALNASVEAARAGEHGKGFAVVAEEVRNLADKSQSAAKETTALIDESIARVNEGISIANITAVTLEKIVGEVSQVSKIITDITIDAEQQDESINQITIGISQVADVVQKNSSTSEEAASASQELLSQAEMLKNLVGSFKRK